MSQRPSNDRAGRRTIGSIETGVRLLAILVEAGKPLMLKEIAAEAGMAPAKAHRYMASFVASGMVSQKSGSARYGLGPFATRLGIASIAQHDVLQRASAMLAQFRDSIHETCFLSCWCDQGPVIFKWEDSQRSVTVAVQVGSIMPLSRSATGRCFLAFMPRERLDPVLEKEIAETGISQNDIDLLIDDARETGLGYARGDFQTDVDALSAPLLSSFGDMVGAVTALGRRGKFPVSRSGRVASELRNFVSRISDDLVTAEDG